MDNQLYLDSSDLICNDLRNCKALLMWLDLELICQETICDSFCGERTIYKYNLTIVTQWLRSFGASKESTHSARAEALAWARERGSRSGRVAYQFARDFAGKQPTQQ